MTTVNDTIDDYIPSNAAVAVPLISTIEILFDREMDEDFLEETIFISGPDTDQFVGVDFTLLEDPDNVSQGDDFLESPNFKGIVQGTVSFKKISTTDPDTEVLTTPYRTKYIFTPDHALSALTEYTVHIPEVKDTSAILYEGYVTFSWTTGSGSITALPSSGSTSVLGKSGSEDTSELEISKTIPADHAIQINPNKKQLTIEFSTKVDPTTVTKDKFTITVEPATEHPNASINYSENELAFSLTTDENKVYINI